MLQQAVQRAQRVVLGIGCRLVDLVDHDHRVGILAVHQRLEHLARPRALPLGGRAREQPTGGHRAHGHHAHAGAQQIGQLAREMGLADARRAQQQHGRDLQAVAAVLRQRHVALDVVQRVGEVGQLLIQVAHVGYATGFDLEALGAALEHALVSVAKRLVLMRGQLGQLALHVAGPEHTAQMGDRQLEAWPVDWHQWVGRHSHLLGQPLFGTIPA